MNKIKKDAEKEFRKLSKKEQRRINELKRIPVPAPGTVFDKKKTAPRKKNGMRRTSDVPADDFAGRSLTRRFNEVLKKEDGCTSGQLR